MDVCSVTHEQITSWGNTATTHINDARGIFYSIARETLKRVWQDIATHIGKTWKAVHVAHGRSKDARNRRPEVQALLEKVEIQLGIREAK